MELSQRLLELPPEAAARVLTLAVLDEAKVASRRLADDHDTEALHDFRVGLRRCRTLLKAYRSVLKGSVSKKLMKSLRGLAAGTGDARDSEVQLEWLRPQEALLKASDRPAWAWLVERLEDRRGAGYGKVREELIHDFNALEPRLREGLSHYVASIDQTPQRSFAVTAGDLVREAGEDLQAALEKVKVATDVEEAHEARIRAKRLRYVLEPLRQTELGAEAADLVKRMKGFQEVLGELHDAHVSAAEIASSLVETATERVRHLHEALYAGAAGDAPKRSSRDLRSGLLAIDRLIRDRVRSLFETLQTEWLGERFQDFQARLITFADGLSSYQGAPLEIERKYLLKSLPVFGSDVASAEITQGYIPGKNIRERLRRVESSGATRFFRTIKFGHGIQRLELEDKTEEAIFQQLWPLTEGHRVRKRRYKIPVGDLIWEIDHFLDRDLVLAEVELDSPDVTVEPPEWLKPHLVREVTGEPEYLNENLGR